MSEVDHLNSHSGFEDFFESASQNELLLKDGGFCQFHLRADGQLTIYSIISLRPGVGRQMLDLLKQVPGVKSIFVKCPRDLPANDWYPRQGFVLEEPGTPVGPNHRLVDCWRLIIQK